jgi:hypothetical protein
VKIKRLDTEKARKFVNLAVIRRFSGICGSAQHANRGKSWDFCGCEMKRPPEANPAARFNAGLD